MNGAVAGQGGIYPTITGKTAKVLSGQSDATTLTKVAELTTGTGFVHLLHLYIDKDVTSGQIQVKIDGATVFDQTLAAHALLPLGGVFFDINKAYATSVELWTKRTGGAGGDTINPLLTIYQD